MIRRLALSGLLRSGKDYVAEKTGFHVVSIAEPMYEICRNAFGYCNKDDVQHRKFLQYIGQVGWGCKSEEYPHDAFRAMFESWMRGVGEYYSKRYDINWCEFGRRKDFWINAAVKKAMDLQEFNGVQKVAFTNVRFEHELKPLQDNSYEHYLVVCSLQTRIERLGGKLDPKVANDASERFAVQLLNTLPHNRIIWNDHRQCEVTDFLTLEQFIEIANGE